MPLRRRFCWPTGATPPRTSPQPDRSFPWRRNPQPPAQGGQQSPPSRVSDLRARPSQLLDAGTRTKRHRVGGWGTVHTHPTMRLLPRAHQTEWRGVCPGTHHPWVSTSRGPAPPRGDADGATRCATRCHWCWHQLPSRWPAGGRGGYSTTGRWYTPRGGRWCELPHPTPPSRGWGRVVVLPERREWGPPPRSPSANCVLPSCFCPRPDGHDFSLSFLFCVLPHGRPRALGMKPHPHVSIRAPLLLEIRRQAPSVPSLGVASNC